MRKLSLVLFSILFLSQPVLALAGNDADSENSKPCAAVAKACKDAGFAKKAKGKPFWKDCMKPLLLAHQVNGVTLSADTIHACQVAKIEELKKEVAELEGALASH